MPSVGNAGENGSVLGGVCRSNAESRRGLGLELVIALRLRSIPIAFNLGDATAELCLVGRFARSARQA